MNFAGSPLTKPGKKPGLPLLVSGTVSEITNPFPAFGEQVPSRRTTMPVELKSTPLQMVDTKTPVDVFKNQQRAPGTKPAYGMVQPDRF
jgi:hypothetical protein